MPFNVEAPAIPDLISAFRDGIVGEGNKYTDVRAGSMFEHISGPAAIIWSREAHRDTDLFDAIYLGSSDGSDLTDRMTRRYGIDRVLDTYGTGSIVVTRPTTGAGAGTIWTGTKILVTTASKTLTYDTRVYVVASDVTVSSTAKTATVPIRAEKTGKGVALITDDQGTILRFDDPLWDSSLVIKQLNCSDGTEFESAPAARARVRTTLRDGRVGYVKEMIDVCKAAGAANVVFLDSDLAGATAVDYGLPFCYVSDASFSSPQPLINACAVALEKSKICGSHLQVCGMIRRNFLNFTVNINMWEPPTSFNLEKEDTLIRNAIVQYFKGASDGYSFDRRSVGGAIMHASKDVQEATVVDPAFDGTILVGTTPPFFPVILNRWSVEPNNIILNFLGPQ